MKFGIVASDVEKARALSKKIAKFLGSHGHEVIEKLQGSEIILVLGGDGTLIHAACECAGFNVPFFGINVGTLGFLTAAEADDWQDAIDKLISGKYFISERMTLAASVATQNKRHLPRRQAGETRNTYRAVNEVVVKGMYRVVDLEILNNGQKFLRVVGDGVILATQTGSTAYSLSAGGPIVDPHLDCILVTPINAVGLPIPSVVISQDDVVDIKILEGDDVSLIIDGQEHLKVTGGYRVKVVKGKNRVKFGYFDKHHFLKALNAKFGLASRAVK